MRVHYPKWVYGPYCLLNPIKNRVFILAEVSIYIFTHGRMAMAHNEFILLQLNLHHFIRGRFRWRRGFRHCRMWRRTWLHPVRIRAFGIYDQLLVELRQEDPSTFQDFFCMDPVYDEILAIVRGRIWKPHTWFRKPLEEGLKAAVTLRHLVAGTMYSDMQCGWRVPKNTLLWSGRCVRPYVTSMQMRLWPRWMETTCWWILQALKFPQLCCCYWWQACGNQKASSVWLVIL